MEELKNLMDKANENLNAGNLSEAMKYLDQALKIDPDNLDALFNKVILLTDLGNIDQAEITADKFIELEPDNVDGPFLKGYISFFNDQINEAFEYYDDALKIDPDHLPSLIGKGDVLIALDKYDDAIECLNRAIAIDDTNIGALFNKGLALTGKEQLNEAIQFYDKALAIDPENVLIIKWKAQALAGLGKEEEANELLDSTIETKKIDVLQFVKQSIEALNSPNTELREHTTLNLFDSSSQNPSGCYLDENGTLTYIEGVEKFNQIAREIAMDTIIQGLNDEDHRVRVGLAQTLGHLNDPRGVNPLIIGLRDSEIRGVCTTALIGLKEYSYLPLLEAIKSEDKYVRRASIEALGEIANPDSYDHLINALNDPDWNVRFKTIEAIGKLGDVKSLDPLSKCLDDKSANVRKKATEVIGILAVGEKVLTRAEFAEERRKKHEERDKLIKPLLNDLNNEDPEIREEAKRKLDDMGVYVSKNYKGEYTYR